MASRRSTERGGARRVGLREAGALRRARPPAPARTPWQLAGAVAAALLASVALAGPNLFAGTIHAPCPEAVLPMRMGTFQSDPATADEIARWLAIDEFKEAHPWISTRRGAGPIHIVVFAYVGSLARSMALEVSTPGGRVTWRAEVALDPPDAGVLTMSFYPYYAQFPVPTAAWRSIFPEPGPYLLRAWRPGPPGTYPDAFCSAEATSWILVAR